MTGFSSIGFSPLPHFPHLELYVLGSGNWSYGTPTPGEFYEFYEFYAASTQDPCCFIFALDNFRLSVILRFQVRPGCRFPSRIVNGIGLIRTTFLSGLSSNLSDQSDWLDGLRQEYACYV